MKDFSYPKLSTCCSSLNSGGFGRPYFENAFWPNSFCKKILLWPIHMARLLGNVLDQGKEVYELEDLFDF